MNKTKLALYLSFLFLFINLNSLLANDAVDKILFHELSWSEALEMAEQQDKLIFVDFYATWCGPCKWMANEVFTDYDVAEYFNENFINLSIDAEKEELELVESIMIDAYPTLIIFNAEGDIVRRNVGALASEDLLYFGESAIQLPDLASAYEEDPTDYSLVLSYLEQLIDTEPEKANEVAIMYLNSIEKSGLQSLDSWEIIKYVSDYSASIIDYVMENSEYYSVLDGFENFGMGLFSAMVYESVYKEDLILLNEAIDFEIEIRKISGTMSFEEDYYRLETEYLFYQLVGDIDKYIVLYDTFLRKYHWEEAEYLCSSAIQFIDDNYYEVTELDKMQMAMTWANRAVELESTNWYPHFTVAIIQYYDDEFDDAYKNASLSLELVEEPDYKDMVAELLAEIEMVRSDF